jgi:hypothetical protein
MKHLRTGFVGIATAFCGIAACQEAVAPVWVKALATENNALKVSREGNVASNGTLAWTVADGEPLLSYNSHMAMWQGDLYTYFHAFAMSHDASTYYYGRRGSGLWTMGADGTPTHVDIRNYLWYDMDLSKQEGTLGLMMNRDVSQYETSGGSPAVSSASGPPRHVLALRDFEYLMSGPYYRTPSSRYDKGFSMYPIALAPDWTNVLQMSATGVTCYRLVDGVQLWTKSITNLAT